ncbi:MAG TPA: permease-like cell division protein FtsX [Desulfatiglandales bacterium]|nr:permease-like cell division protein FtsX [Desulfatiglandales bacterium]
MRITFFRYVIRKALENILENRLVHLIGIGTMAIAFLIFYAFILIFVNLNYWMEEQGKSLTMSIYFKVEPDPDMIEDVKKELSHFPGTTIKRFISKDDALKRLKSQLGDKAELLDVLKENPLPASLEIVFSGDKKEDFLPYKLKARLESFDMVDEVQYSQDWIKKVQIIMRGIKIVGLIFGGLLFFAALFIITNTIKLTVYSRKKEIEILKLVGATNGFVKAPFLIEGSIQGFFGGATALIVLFLVYILATTGADLRVGFASLDIIFISPQYIISLLLLSIVIGFIGSAVTLGRFLVYE